MEGRRRLVQIVPNPMREWWDKWEIRGLVVISLVSQMILTLLGNRRKYGTNKVMDSILWCAYLLGDQVPAIALGAISGKLGDYYDKQGQQMEDPQLVAFWAPFFLMHIGGPDTISAYSLEDNGLWLRHLVGLVVQTLLTLYIILLSWDSTSWLSYLSLPMLMTGCVKYGGRTWSLYSASGNYERDFWQVASYVSESEELTDKETGDDLELRALFKVIMVSHFSDMLLATKDIKKLKRIFLLMNSTTAFPTANVINGILYDVFYTKASATVSIWGCISRVVTLFVLVVVLTLHSIFSIKSNKYLRVDRIITYILLVSAIILDFLSIILLLLSSEMSVLLFLAFKPIIEWCRYQILEKTKRKSLAQCNLLTALCSGKNRFNISGDSFPIGKLEKIHILTHCPISSDSELMEMIFHNIMKKSNESTPIQSRLGPRYKELVKAQRLHRRRLMIENLEFHQTILLWHIVTDVCYHCDDNRNAHENEVHSKESKQLSDYMFYLLVKQRHMLPIGTGLPSLRDTLAEAIKYCEHKTLTLTSNESEACKALLQHITEDTEYAANHPKGRSVFRYAFVTAHDLLTRGDMKQIWEFLIELWIEILNYGAAHCRADRHIQQLRYGGEFVTHIWTLQFFAGLPEQFQLTQPFIEDENIVEVEIL